MLEDAYRFIRISRSVLLNMDHIKNYLNSEPCVIHTKSGQVFEVSRRRRTETLKILKTALPDISVLKNT